MDGQIRGVRQIEGVPFRYGGILHNWDKTADEWAEDGKMYRKCYGCGGNMKPLRPDLYKTFPYIATFKVTKGKNKGKKYFKILCRTCAYIYGKGVIECDGRTYQNYYDFKESKWKKETGYRFVYDEDDYGKED